MKLVHQAASTNIYQAFTKHTSSSHQGSSMCAWWRIGKCL